MRTIVIPLFPGFQPLDVVGPHDVFTGANDAMDELDHSGLRYDVVLASKTLEPVQSHTRLSLVPDALLDDLGSVHTLIVPGGVGTRESESAAPVIEWLRDQAPNAERIASVCTGAFLLAAAGLCTGRKVTTHWSYAPRLAKLYPDLQVDPDPIFIQDGTLWTSAGVSAGIDLALAMVEQDCGSSVAQLVARHLVVYVRRPGGQSQFGAPAWSQSAETQPIRSACDLIHTSPEQDLSVSALASRVGLSERHFTRTFRSEIGESPARYVDRVRVDTARSILETESVGLERVAQRCGFANTETLRRAFHRRLGISPATYRRQSSVTR